MSLFRRAAAAVVLCLGLAAPAAAQSPEPRLALVLGNVEYAGAPAPTAANDAGLVAESLRQAGFDVTGAANLDADSLRAAIDDFVAKVGSQGQGGVALVYLAGRGVQFAGDNYFLPVGAQIAADADIPRFGARISDLTRALSSAPLKARLVVLDAARATPMLSGVQLAGGLQFVEADPGSLVAFNAAPGTIAPEEPAPYGTYARAFVEQMHEGGVPVEEVFVRTRLRVNEVSKGAMIPWHSSKLDQRVVFFEAAADAKPSVSMEQTANIRKRPIRDFSADEAYSVAIERDNLATYQEYVNAYPNAAQARRVRALLAARREARIWRDTYLADTPNAYWTYLRRYPRGPHAFDARRRLQILRAALEPPAQFELYEYRNVPPPPPEEIVFVERRPALLFDNGYDLPPPPPDYFLPPRRAAFYELAPPPPPPAYGYLPALGVAAVGIIAAPAIMRALKPVRPQGQYLQPNFGQVRNQQGLVLPGQQGGLQMLSGGQTQQLPPRQNFGARPQFAPQPGLAGQGLRPAAPGLLPGAGSAQPLPGAGQIGRPAALPGAGGAQPLPGAGQLGRPAALPGASGQFGRPAAPAAPATAPAFAPQNAAQQRQQQLQQQRQQALQQRQQQQLQAQQQRQQALQQRQQQQLQAQQQRQQALQQRQQQAQQQRQQQAQQRQQLLQQRQQQAQQRQQQAQQRQQLLQQRQQQAQQRQQQAQQRQQQAQQQRQMQQQRQQQMQQQRQQLMQQRQQAQQQRLQQMQQRQRPAPGNPPGRRP